MVGRAILKLPSVERLLIGVWNRPLLANKNAIARSQKFIGAIPVTIARQNVCC